MTQKALIVRTGPDGHEGLEELNIELERGWRVTYTGPMGGASGPSDGPTHAALVILEHEDPDQPGAAVAAEAFEEVEEEAEEVVEGVVEEVVDGNGANPDPPDRPQP